MTQRWTHRTSKANGVLRPIGCWKLACELERDLPQLISSVWGEGSGKADAAPVVDIAESATGI